MSTLYNRIEQLCASEGISITQMCKNAVVPRGSLGDLKAGRSKSLSATILTKVAEYFDVSVDYLLGNTDIKKEPATVSGDKLIPGYSDLTEENKAKTREYIALLLNSQ